MIRLRFFSLIVLWNIIWDLIFFWALLEIKRKLDKEEETKEPIFVWEDENGNWLYKFE